MGEDAAQSQGSLSLEEILEERAACEEDPAYFIEHYCWIKDDKNWFPFRLWGFQVELCDEAFIHRLLIVLKARQIGVSWIFLGVLLWGAIFEPGCLQLLFSLKHKEAKKLLGRLKGMYGRLPRWLQADRVVVDNEADWALSNGSTIEAYPASGGDSNNARRVLVDEADLIPNLSELLDSLQPTIEDGDSSLYMISRSNKRLPQSTFKRMYREAKAGRSDWTPAFYPFDARPDRGEAFHARQCRSAMAKDANLDFVHSNYPKTDAEALAPATGGKRLPHTHLLPCYEESVPLAKLPRGAPAIPELRVYKLPEEGRAYRAGADPAEGLPGSNHDDSALVIVDKVTGEEVAAAHGRWEPKHVFPAVIDEVCRWYMGCPVLVERNNHGHTVLLALESCATETLCGPDGRPGYAKSPASKAQLWSDAWGEVVSRSRDVSESVGTEQQPPLPLIRDFVSWSQLSMLEAATCKAPPGERDDVADGWGLAQKARTVEPFGDIDIEVI